MKLKRKLPGLAFILSAILVLQLPPSGADAASVPEFIITGSGTLVSYNGTKTDVVIPNTVIEIATDAFRDNDKIRTVTIPNSVKKINEYAFWDCDSLESVSIGTGLNKIDDFVFANCMGLVSVSLPANIKSIGIYAFEDDVNLEAINITENVHNIHESSFDGCYKLIIFAPEGSYAWDYAQKFYERQKEFPVYEETGVIGNDDVTVEPEENGDVSGNGETTVEEGTGEDPLPAGAWTTEYEITARPDGTYTAVAINQNTDIYGESHVVGNSAVVFMNNSAYTVYDGTVRPVSEDDSQDTGAEDNTSAQTIYSSSIPKYTIVDSRIVADKAFYMSDDTHNMSLPSGVREIGQLAFARTEVLSVTLPEGVERIDYGAFYHCSSLTDVNLPSSVMKVEPYAFTGTPWVDDFLAGKGSGNNQLDDDLNSSEGDFLVSGGTLIAYRGTGSNVTIPSGVRVVAAGCFKDKVSIRNVAFPDTLISIGEEAFMGCVNLSEVSFGGNETEILDRAFAETKVSIADKPDRIVNVGIGAFDDLEYSEDIHITFEESAQRLSNVQYRDSVQDKDNAGVTVIGEDGVQAYLNGADRPFTLSVSHIDASDEFDTAYSRASAFLQGFEVEDRSLYDIVLTDASGIPLTKLGNQGLEIAIPVPESLKGKKLFVLTVDRNGQLEDIPVAVVESSDKLYARFTTFHLSVFALCSGGEELNEDGIITSDVVLRAASGGPANAVAADPSIGSWAVSRGALRWIISGMLVLTGILLLFVRKKSR